MKKLFFLRTFVTSLFIAFMACVVFVLSPRRVEAQASLVCLCTIPSFGGIGWWLQVSWDTPPLGVTCAQLNGVQDPAWLETYVGCQQPGSFGLSQKLVFWATSYVGPAYAGPPLSSLGYQRP